MNYQTRLTRTAACVFAFFIICSGALAAPVTKTLATGVTLSQDICADPGQELVVNAVTVEIGRPGIDVKAAIGQDVILTSDWRKGREEISSITGRKDALVGVNADFFPYTGCPIGTCIVDGQLLREPTLDRPALAVRSDHTIFLDTPKFDATLTMANGVSRQIDGINRGRETNQVVAYTEAYGASILTKYKGTDVVLTSGELPIKLGKSIRCSVSEVKTDAENTPIPKGAVVLSGGGPAAAFLKENLRPGDTVTLTFNIKSAGTYDWTAVEQAVEGGPWLLKDGQECINADEEGFEHGFFTTHHPRTAAGLTADGKLVIATVDGRQTISGGLSLSSLASLMKQLGAVDAINLDGGGSTTLSVKGIVVNSPSEGAERPVADALLIYAPQPPLEELTNLTLNGAPGEAVSGQSIQLALTCGADNHSLNDSQLDDVVWGVNGGVGFVSQTGRFTPVKAGKGAVDAMYGNQRVSSNVTVVGGPPANVKTDLVADKSDPYRSVVNVTLSDANGNLLPDKEVVLSAVGGKLDAQNGITGNKGEFSTGIAWDASALDRKVTAVVKDANTETGTPPVN